MDEDQGCHCFHMPHFFNNMIQKNKCTFKKDSTLSKLLSPLSQKGSTVGINSSPFQKGLGVLEEKQEATKVFTLVINDRKSTKSVQFDYAPLFDTAHVYAFCLSFFQALLKEHVDVSIHVE